MNKTINFIVPLIFFLAGLLSSCIDQTPKQEHPNILFCISDDQLWLHTGAMGDPIVKTPAFDRIASEGILFTHAFCNAPTCTASRSAIVTGQDIWRLEEGGTLHSTLPKKFQTYTELLKEAGYSVGHTSKGWSPGKLEPGGRTENPAGQRYDSFQEFFDKRIQDTDAPFCFWLGSGDPHRPYEWLSGLKSGMGLDNVVVPSHLPDDSIVRCDILDYYFEIERFDQSVAQALKLLENTGKLDNTLIVVTSDNGMPFPRGKASLYDFGTRMPLAIRWPAGIKRPGRIVDDFVSLKDLAPTYLEAAGIKQLHSTTGRSLSNIFVSTKEGKIDAARNEVFTAMERHSGARKGAKGYPCRAIRTYEFLYIRNYEPTRWPSGDPNAENSVFLIPFGEVNSSPTKTLLMVGKTWGDSIIVPLYMKTQQRNMRYKKAVKSVLGFSADSLSGILDSIQENNKLFQIAFAKRPAEELYDLRSDPFQLNNVASLPKYVEIKRELSGQLQQYTKMTSDPRALGKDPQWDSYPIYYDNPINKDWYDFVDSWKPSPTE